MRVRLLRGKVIARDTNAMFLKVGIITHPKGVFGGKV